MLFDTGFLVDGCFWLLILVVFDGWGDISCIFFFLFIGDLFDLSSAGKSLVFISSWVGSFIRGERIIELIVC